MTILSMMIKELSRNGNVHEIARVLLPCLIWGVKYSRDRYGTDLLVYSHGVANKVWYMVKFMFKARK